MKAVKIGHPARIMNPQFFHIPGSGFATRVLENNGTETTQAGQKDT